MTAFRNARRGKLGSAFEQEILYAGAVYRARKIAVVYKFNLPIKVGQGGKAIFFEKTGFDFSGHARKDGKLYPLYIEAKDSETKLTLPILHPGVTNQFGLKHHQLRELIEAEEMGCLAYVLWKRGNEVYRLSPSDIMNHVGVGRAVRVEAHSDILTHIPYRDGLLDFLLVAPPHK